MWTRNQLVCLQEWDSQHLAFSKGSVAQVGQSQKMPNDGSRSELSVNQWNFNSVVRAKPWNLSHPQVIRKAYKKICCLRFHFFLNCAQRKISMNESIKHAHRRLWFHACWNGNIISKSIHSPYCNVQDLFSVSPPAPPNTPDCGPEYSVPTHQPGIRVQSETRMLIFFKKTRFFSP